MNKKNYITLATLISTVSFFYGIYFTQFHYDGLHFGLIYDQSLDFLDKKKPYKDFFSMYGYITVYLHSLAIKTLDQGMYSLVILTNLFYSISFILLYFLSKKFLDDFCSLLIVLIIFLIHPSPSYPWANYILYFFILVSLILIFSNKKYFFLASILFALIVFLREGFFLHALLFIFYLLFINFFSKSNEFKNKYSIKKNFIFITIFVLFILIFLFYFFKIEILKDFFNYLSLPKIYLEIKETSLLSLFLDLYKYLFNWNFYKFFTGSYILIFSLIFITNLAFIFKIFAGILMGKEIDFKDLEISLISVLSLMFYSYSLNEINIFRLICGSAVGLISLIYFINKLSINLKEKFLFILFLMSIFNLNLVNKNDANLIYKNKSEIAKSVQNNIDHFSNFKFNQPTTNNLILLEQYFKSIKKKCSINYSLNYQLDVIPKIISRKYFFNFQMVPWLNDHQSKIFIKYFDKNFYEKLIFKMINNDLIIITNFKGKKEIESITKNFDNINYKVYSELPFSYDQKKILILTPKICN